MREREVQFAVDDQPQHESMRRSPFKRVLNKSAPALVLASIAGCLLLWFFWFWIFVTINPGEAGVLYRLFSGVQTGRVYSPGLYIIAPWNTMFRYETRKQVVTHELTVLSNRGLEVQLSLAIRYQPEIEQLGLLHQRIGPDYVRRAILSQVESALRRELGLRTAEQIYTNDGGVLNEALVLARDEVGRNYVQAEDIVIRSIALPPPVKAAIEAKLTQRELLESYSFRLQTAEAEAERRRREARGVADYNTAVDATLTDPYLQFEGIRAALALATAKRTSVVLINSELSFSQNSSAPAALDSSAQPMIIENDQPPAIDNDEPDSSTVMSVDPGAKP